MKVTKIIDSSFKSGVGKNGKPWTLIKIEADGKEATGFGPVQVGDEVDLTFNQQYSNYSFKVLKGSEIPDAPRDDLKLLQLVFENTEEILRILNQTVPRKPTSLGDTYRAKTKTGTTSEFVEDEDTTDEPQEYQGDSMPEDFLA